MVLDNFQNILSREHKEIYYMASIWTCQDMPDHTHLK